MPAKRPEALTRRNYLVKALRDYERLVDTAEDLEQMSAAVAAKDKAVKIRAELDQFDEAERVTKLPESVEEHRDEVLRRCRRMRVAAEAGNSFVAAERLLKLEAQLVQDKEDRAKLVEGPDERETEELLAAAMSIIDGLPPALRAKIGLPA